MERFTVEQIKGGVYKGFYWIRDTLQDGIVAKTNKKGVLKPTIKKTLPTITWIMMNLEDTTKVVKEV